MTRITITALCLATFSLSACQGFPLDFGMNERPAAASAPDMTSYFAQRMSDGRNHLRHGRAGAAITAFRQASYHPDYAAEAFNGLGVAYDRLGRYDLAERYFLAAVEAAPLDERFARNAARFETAMLARNNAGGDGVDVAVAEGQGEASGASAPMAAAQPAPLIGVEADGQRLNRVSRRVVQIRSAEALPPVASRQVVQAPDRRASVAVTGRLLAQRATPAYPVRVSLQREDAGESRGHVSARGLRANSPASVRTGALASADAPAPYPVRVVLHRN